MKSRCLRALALVIVSVAAASAAAQTPHLPMPIDPRHSAEAGWLAKEVIATRSLDDMTRRENWVFQGTGKLTFLPSTNHPARIPALRVDMDMFTRIPAPTRSKLSSVNLKRAFTGENWSDYNRISFWVRPQLSGFPMLPIQIVLHNDGKEKVPDAYYREGIHYVTLENDKWQQVVWEITPLARDKVTSLEIGYWVNKMLAAPTDRVAFEIGSVELQRVTPDHYEGWKVAPGKIAYSHTGYQSGSQKTALASGLSARRFSLIRIGDGTSEKVVLEKPVQTVNTRFGEFQRIDFSEVRDAGSYVIAAGDVRTRLFRIDDNVWKGTLWKTINFFYAERCGYAVPGHHGVDHKDWFATLGDRKIVMNGGWHDAGDLSQGVINTGEATYAMFALAEQLMARGGEPELSRRLIEEAKWGLDWVLKVRFPGGYRIAFASHNLWSNGIIGDEDDRSREAKNNPNANYIAAAAEAIAYRVLKRTDPVLAARSLATAEEDWRFAIAGTEGPGTWHTPAFAASPVELAGIGILASLELHSVTGKKQYADKGFELARIIVASQQKSFVGTTFPLAGFFYTGPDRDTLFHQFHRGNDQAPIIGLSRLVAEFPRHEDWMSWYSVVALYSEYQKKSSRATAPWGVLPAYVYHDREFLQVPEKGALHMATRDAFRDQVLNGMPMGGGYYLKAFPVWFARRGNYGVLLSQAKALSAASQLRGDRLGLELAQTQAQWIVGRNPFVQSTMYGEGYDWAQQYNVSSGDMVGSLPVGMQSRGNTDLPYWPSQNMYVYKEVWIHPASRWLWLMQDLAGPTSSDDSTPIAAGAALKFAVVSETSAKGEVTINLEASGSGVHTFSVRAENLVTNPVARSVSLRPGKSQKLQWRTPILSTSAPWVAVVIPDGDVKRRREVLGSLPRFAGKHVTEL
ncbi:MAG: glycoside hydrolase family 9 protein [Gemmatimonadaceae bacterium]